MRKLFIHIYSQEAAMRDLIMVLIILILIALLCVYVHLSLTLSSIDTISIETEEYMKNKIDPEFDADRFRSYIKALLEKITFLDENSVIFYTPFYARRKNQNSLNAHTGLPGQKVIIFTPGWAARLYEESFAQKSDGSIIDFFRFVLGHEMTHKDMRQGPIFIFGKKRVCDSWIREIRSDFGGIRKAGLSPERVRQCLEKEVFGREGNRQRRTSTKSMFSSHPTWEYRMQCWDEGSMSAELIEKICKDCGVTDKPFCDKMKRLYVEKAARTEKMAG